jgi:hypothetical protein
LPQELMWASVASRSGPRTSAFLQPKVSNQEAPPAAEGRCSSSSNSAERPQIDARLPCTFERPVYVVDPSVITGDRAAVPDPLLPLSFTLPTAASATADVWSRLRKGHVRTYAVLNKYRRMRTYEVTAAKRRPTPTCHIRISSCIQIACLCGPPNNLHPPRPPTDVASSSRVSCRSLTLGNARPEKMG